MPQRFNHAVITNAGAALLTKAQAGQCRMMFTRLLTGDGTYSEEEQTLEFLQQRDALKSGKASFAFSSMEMVSEHSVKATALITNSDPITQEVLISEGYFINELGIYAKESDGDDSSEVLYCIVTTAGTNGDFMPPYNGYSPARIIQEFYLTVSNSAQVTVKLDNSAVALAEDVQEIRDIIRGLFSVQEETLALSIGLPNWIIGSSGSQGYSLPLATADTPGLVKIGEGIEVDDQGTIRTDIQESAQKAADLIETKTEYFSSDEILALFKSN